MANTEAHAEHSEDHGIAHVMPLWILIGVFLALVLLTVVTVGAHWYVDLGPGNIWLAMAIATVKALLVAVYFMHLRYDKPLNTVLLVGSVLFVVLFICFSLVDAHQYGDNIEDFRRRNPTYVEEIKKPVVAPKH